MNEGGGKEQRGGWVYREEERVLIGCLGESQVEVLIRQGREDKKGFREDLLYGWRTLQENLNKAKR